MRKNVVFTVTFLVLAGMLLVTGADISLNAQSQPTVIPVNIDKYLQNPNVSVTVNWQLQQSIQWYSNQYEFKVMSVAPVPGDTTAPPDAFYRHFPDPNDTFANSVSSTIARPEAGGHTYKVSFQLQDGTMIDPDVIVRP